MRLAWYPCFAILLLIQSGCAVKRPLSEVWKIPIIDLQGPETQIPITLSPQSDFATFLLVSKETKHFRVGLTPGKIAVNERNSLVCLIELLRESGNTRQCIISKVMCVGDCGELSSKDLASIPLRYIPWSFLAISRIAEPVEIQYKDSSTVVSRKQEVIYSQCRDIMSFKSKRGAQYFLGITSLKSKPAEGYVDVVISFTSEK